MKFLILGPAHPLRGGIAAFNERLAKELIAEGHSVEIVSFRFQYPSFLFPGTSQFTDAPAPSDLIIHSSVHSLNPFNWIKLGKSIRQKSPDILIVRFWIPLMAPCLGTILRFVAKNKHTRIICIADNIVPHEKRKGDKLLTQYFVKPIHAFITMSETVLHDLRIFTQKCAIVEPHPLYDHFGAPVSTSEARTYLNIDQQSFIFLFFGFIRKYKGLDILMYAVAKLKHQGIRGFQVLVAGEFYEDRTYYDELIKTLGIEAYVLLKTNYIPDEEVRYYMCAADAVVQPYRNATQSGVTPLAYHFEVPMIVTNVGGLPAMVTHQKSGLICSPNADEVADAMKEMMANGRQAYIPALRLEKQKYSWRSMTSAILKLANESTTFA